MTSADDARGAVRGEGGGGGGGGEEEACCALATTGDKLFLYISRTNEVTKAEVNMDSF